MCKSNEGIDQALEVAMQEKWKEFVQNTDIDNLRLPMESFSAIRVVFQLAYQQGQTDMFTQVKQIYDEDVDLFQDLFEDEEDRKLFS